MKNIRLVLLLLISGCAKFNDFGAKYYDVYMQKYLYAHVDNQSGRDVRMTFCTTESTVVSKVETVPANERNFKSSTFVLNRLVGRADHPQLGQLSDNTKDTFALVSEEDSNFIKVCSSSNNFVLIDLVSTCPDGYEVLMPDQVPCSVNP